MPKGSKTCNACGVSCGPRTKICPCGAAFTFKDTTPASQAINTNTNVSPAFSENQIAKQFGSVMANSIILVPGKHFPDNDKKSFCPYPLENTNEETVLSWLDDMQNHKIACAAGVAKYARAAIIYFVDYVVPRYLKGEPNPAYDIVVNIIKNNMEPYAEEV